MSQNELQNCQEQMVKKQMAMDVRRLLLASCIDTISRLREKLLARSLLATRILGGDPGVELGLKQFPALIP